MAIRLHSGQSQLRASTTYGGRQIQDDLPRSRNAVTQAALPWPTVPLWVPTTCGTPDCPGGTPRFLALYPAAPLQPTTSVQ